MTDRGFVKSDIKFFEGASPFPTFLWVLSPMDIEDKKIPSGVNRLTCNMSIKQISRIVILQGKPFKCFLSDNFRIYTLNGWLGEVLLHFSSKYIHLIQIQHLQQALNFYTLERNADCISMNLAIKFLHPYLVPALTLITMS